MLKFDLNFFITFSLISFIFTYFVAKYSHFFFSGTLIDKDFLKPQAFHKEPTARAGGIVIFLLFSLFIFFYFLTYGVLLKDYLTISLLMFLLGFLDDLKIKINPNIRLFLMLIILGFCISFFSIQITRTHLEFLNFWLENNIFQLCFVLLCYLFIINGSNLIDGFNGLLAIHFLIINIIFLIINFLNQHETMSFVLLAQIIIVLSFLLFNFPKAKIFLGDSGSYLLGSLIAFNAIKTYELNLNVTPFFYASILFYLFYEVFFSFIRKSLQKKSPLKPDNSHLHMLIYKFLSKSKKFSNANCMSSFLINSVFFISITPTIYFYENGLVLRYYFFIQTFIYTIIYYYFSNSKKR
jgi:UDP-GlcNAc:undecaprenyl-phosphate GlcNAc-1-phosphate transferase